MFSCEFCQISKNTFFTEHLWATASILRETRRLNQIEISIISKLHKENDKKNKNVLTFFIFYLLRTFFFFSGFTFYKEASYFIIFILSLCANMLNLENILEYIRQKLKKKTLKFYPGIKCLHVFFSFFHPWMKFHPCISSRDEIGWNFISAKICKQ